MGVVIGEFYGDKTLHYIESLALEKIISDNNIYHSATKKVCASSLILGGNFICCTRSTAIESFTKISCKDHFFQATHVLLVANACP